MVIQPQPSRDLPDILRVVQGFQPTMLAVIHYLVYLCNQHPLDKWALYEQLR